MRPCAVAAGKKTKRFLGLKGDEQPSKAERVQSTSGGGGKASEGSVQFWNEQRAALGLKPLRG